VRITIKQSLSLCHHKINNCLTGGILACRRCAALREAGRLSCRSNCAGGLIKASEAGQNNKQKYRIQFYTQRLARHWTLA